MRMVAALPFLLLVATIAGCGDDAPLGYDQWRPLLAAELDRALIDSPDDLYKFLHQGIMGPAHAVPDAAHALGWLRREWDELPAVTPDDRPPLLAPLRPDGRLVRLDLARLRDLVAGAEPDAVSAALDTVAAAFVRTSQRWDREPALLADIWSAVKADTALWRGYFTSADLAALERERGHGWPAVHHSDSYRQHHAPHYRVVDPRSLPAVWRETGGRP